MLRDMFNDVGHVDEVELLLLVAEKLPDVAGEVEKNDAVGRPVAHVLFMSNPEIGAGDFRVAQPYARGNEPSAAETNVEDESRSIPGEIRHVLMRGDQNHGVAFHLGPVRTSTSRRMARGHAAVDFCDEIVGIHRV